MPRFPRLHVGTSGWHYPHWIGPFYPPGLPASEHLGFYARHLATVEINNTFYQMPAAERFRAWKEATPAGFRFAVKASRYMTHMKKLKDPEDALERFLDRVRLLGEKLGPILFQLPPRWGCHAERLERFLALLPPGHRYAFEFRDPSWFCDAVYGRLREQGAAFCIYELAGERSPLVLTADFAYVRLHGPARRKYSGLYSPQALSAWVRRFRTWGERVRDVYLYFDNDEAGYAVRNALQVQRMTAGGLS